MKLLLTPETKRKVDEILVPLKNPQRWIDMKIPFAPTPYAIVRMEGAPGTGKTALSNYMARQMGCKPIRLEFAGTASDQLGETEKHIAAKFKEATDLEIPVIIMEECESLLVSRKMVNDDNMYMLGLLDTMLIEIDRFIARKVPSLLILTTNHPELLDAAIESRITDVIELFPPVGYQAASMWKSKLPHCMTNFKADELITLAKLGATPRQMEKAILKICRKAMLENREPRFEDFELDK